MAVAVPALGGEGLDTVTNAIAGRVGAALLQYRRGLALPSSMASCDCVSGANGRDAAKARGGTAVGFARRPVAANGPVERADSTHRRHRGLHDGQEDQDVPIGSINRKYLIDRADGGRVSLHHPPPTGGASP